MIEKILYDYLSEEMGVPVYMQKPEKLTEASFIIIEKTGSATANHIEQATIAIQSYGATLFEAASLNSELKAVMREAKALNDIAKIQLNSDYNFTDTATKQYRYQAVFVITWYEEV